MCTKVERLETVYLPPLKPECQNCVFSVITVEALSDIQMGGWAENNLKLFQENIIGKHGANLLFLCHHLQVAYIAFKNKMKYGHPA